MKKVIFIAMLVGAMVQGFAKDIKKDFGSFSVPDNYVENKKFSTPEKPFFLTKDDDKKFSSGEVKFANNISVEERHNRYTKENHTSFKQAILSQLTYQSSMAGFDLTGEGYKNKKGYVIYKFVLSPSKDLLKKRPKEPTTTQYYIIAEDYSFILVHETTAGSSPETDNAAELIVDSFQGRE